MLKKSALRNQYGMALWIKILLGLFATGLLIAIAIGIITFTVIKDAMDPKKTQETANKICTLVDPLPAPYAYGQMNVSMGGFMFALINNKSTNGLYFLIKSPRKAKDENAQSAIEKVANGESALPSANGTVTSSGASGSASSKTKMTVEDKGTLDVAGEKMYYVKGKAASTKTASSSDGSSSSGADLDTFFGGVDGKDGTTATFLMIQETDPSKHLTLDDVKTFTGCIKAF
jgi:preprotein translocase subunit YajC